MEKLYRIYPDVKKVSSCFLYGVSYTNGEARRMADNKFSEEKQLARCEPMSRLQSYIAGKWKILILWYISFYKVQRFGELMRRLDGITQSTLTELGQSFLPVLETMFE